ncbi:hypothetical protein LTR05_004911 [Lithohypha guttulata]|uniref:Uncharacterized protein n=1 Tax=Lithohypha guttulata TaxID=1690604 RepID=A0AAN7SZY0_9EURO|nr:hypothetical protein LTR05_004911 [Lithohypha guttulata]
MATPDSGSDFNVMSEEFAMSNGISVDRDPSKRQLLSTATRNVFALVGEARLAVGIQGEQSNLAIETFLVVPMRTFPLVVRNAFLKTHKIFTRFKGYLVKKASSNWRLLQMSPSTESILCKTGAVSSQAILDTGSEKNFISSEHARRNNWTIEKLQHKQFVELSDGSMIRVSGSVEKEIVIDDSCEVLLGDEFISETDIYNKIEQRGWCVDDMHVQDLFEDEIPNYYGIHWHDRVDEKDAKIYAAYGVPVGILIYLSSQIQPTVGCNIQRRSWWRIPGRRSRPQSREEAYHRLHSYLWQDLKTNYSVEAHAQQVAQLNISAAIGKDLDTLRDEDDLRRQHYQNQRVQLNDLIQQLKDWAKADSKTTSLMK